MKNWIRTFCAFATVVVFFISSLAGAQTTSSTSMTGVRRGVAVVMFAGLAGAVIGLSTLSFYGEPQEHIGNIWTGLAIGVLAGSGYMLSQGSRNATSAVAWPTNPHQITKNSAPLMQYQFTF